MPMTETVLILDMERQLLDVPGAGFVDDRMLARRRAVLGRAFTPAWLRRAKCQRHPRAMEAKSQIHRH
jgi:hypothetical protein